VEIKESDISAILNPISLPVPQELADELKG